MRVIVKKPGLAAEICEVEGIQEINKLVLNLDENGNGVNWTSSDIRGSIGHDVDEYAKSDAINNFSLEQNLWTSNDCAVLFGTIVFAGYDGKKKEDCGACSLTDEQIEYCLKYIEKQSV